MGVEVDGRTMQADREQRQAEGGSRGDIRDMQPRAVWYKPDGTKVWPEGQTGPADVHHEKKYRERGWTMAPPEQIEKYRANREARQLRLMTESEVPKPLMTEVETHFLVADEETE